MKGHEAIMQFYGPLKRGCVLIALGCFLVLVSACSRVGNDDRAYFSRQGRSYFVEMKGTRRKMAHDPISGLRGETYEETLIMQLPRIEGVIEGSEIPVPRDKLSYTGQVSITKYQMEVKLYYDEKNVMTKAPLPWNGEYTLIEK
jgi:hypothetical protein